MRSDRDSKRPPERLARVRLLWSALLLSGCGMLIGVDDSKVQGACTTATECAPSYGCLLKECRSSCDSDKDCGLGSRCLLYGVTGSCIPSTEGCGDADEGCPEGTICTESACRTSCGTDADCAGGQACQQVTAALSVCVGTDAGHDAFEAPGDDGGKGGTNGTGGTQGVSEGGAGGAPGAAGGAGGSETVPPDEPGLGTLGARCSNAGALVCAGHAQRQQLLCEAGFWKGNGSCPSGQHCDSREGPNQGLCEPAVEACQGQPADTNVCQDNGVVLCSVDELSASLEQCYSCDAGSCSCPAGTHGEKGGFAECTACESGTFSAEANLAACAPWSDCKAGTRVTNTPSAKEDRACVDCPKDTFTSGPNQSQCLSADACKAGNVQTAPGNASTPPKCAACSAGNYCAGGTAPAEPCAAGTWDHDSSPATACANKTTCLAGSFATEGSTTVDRSCAPCSASTWDHDASPLTACVSKTACKAGQYVSAAGNATTDRTCTDCAAGSYSAAGASSCTTCAADSWDHDANPATTCASKTTCTAGQYVSSEGTTTTNRSCASCPAGSANGATNAAMCTTCTAGNYAAAGASSCSSCAAGAYSAAGASSCTTCTAKCSVASGMYESTACTATTNRVCSVFPSCQGLAANCGASSNDNCCASPTVSGGNFLRGTGNSNPATIATFALDKYEVTVGRFRKFVAAYSGHPANGAGAHPLIANSGWQSPAWDSSIAGNSGELATAVQCDSSTKTWNAAGTNDRLPINCVSWYEAFAFCAWDAGRLPTEAEWEYAAAGGGDGTGERIYPWGNSPGPTDAKTSPALGYANYGCMGDGSAFGDCTFADILAAGSKSSGAGRYTQQDLGGSVWEWGLDWYGNYGALCNNCANLTDALSRVVRGGSWGDGASTLQSAARLDVAPSSHYDIIGFRCARAN